VPRSHRSIVRLPALTALAALSGVLAGVAGWAFLTALDHATATRIDQPWLVWLLPVAGLALGGAYHVFGGRAGEGNALLLDEIHQPTAWVPRRMAPIVAGGTVWSHLFGASVGREGTALQMSGSLTDLLARWVRLGPEDRRTLLVAALGGGFGAVFGVPVAATVFALEVQAVRRLRWTTTRRALDRVRRKSPTDHVADGPATDSSATGASAAGGPAPERPWRRLAIAAVPIAVAAFVGDAVVEALGHQHDIQRPFHGSVDMAMLGKVALLGVLCGLTAVAFVEATDVVRSVARRTVAWAPLRPAVGALLVLAVVAVAGRDQLGLSIPLADAALAGDRIGLDDPLIKLVLTAVCLGFGFIGGEVTPLFVIGATLGAAVGPSIGLDPVTGATVGYVAVFAGAANVPLACTAIGVQLFGGGAALPVAVACAAAYVCSGDRGIYRTQRVITADGHVPVDTLPSALTLARSRARRRRAPGEPSADHGSGRADRPN
jgi:H+/Cl- antiporter ClcA